MSKRVALIIAGTVFAIVAIVHVLRIFYAISVIVASYTLPMWASWVGLFVALILSILMFKASADKT